MATPEKDVKKAAELKLWLEGRIAELQEELERLRETLGYVDETLRATTFKPAIEMMAESEETPDIREVKRDKGGQLLARAAVTPDGVSIEPVEGVTLKAATPPFKSFLVTKILQGMKNKDQELISGGKLADGQGLRFDLEEANGKIERLIIENYRDKARLAEILSTVSWTFSRMLEK
ncbi:MAG: hypothetical protein HY296_03415 [Thaumarchaeota archaeon]|nr:hypothetical protein [Nitrososphaerota archaeon]